LKSCIPNNNLRADGSPNLTWVVVVKAAAASVPLPAAGLS
jgi:hypothetical protein